MFLHVLLAILRVIRQFRVDFFLFREQVSGFIQNGFHRFLARVFLLLLFLLFVRYRILFIFTFSFLPLRPVRRIRRAAFRFLLFHHFYRAFHARLIRSFEQRQRGVVIFHLQRFHAVLEQSDAFQIWFLLRRDHRFLVHFHRRAFRRRFLFRLFRHRLEVGLGWRTSSSESRRRPFVLGFVLISNF